MPTKEMLNLLPKTPSVDETTMTSSDVSHLVEKRASDFRVCPMRPQI
jgi:hypothetical protein